MSVKNAYGKFINILPNHCNEWSDYIYAIVQIILNETFLKISPLVTGFKKLKFHNFIEDRMTDKPELDPRFCWACGYSSK